MLWLGLVLACGTKCEGDECDSESPPDDTGTPDDSGDDSGPDDSATESGDDSADDSGPDDSGWTDTPPDCSTPVASFHGADHSITDLTSAFLDGTYTTLDQPGTLWVCPSTWFARVLLRADISVIGLGADPAETILSAGEQGTVLDIGGPVVVSVGNVTLDRGAALDKSHNSGGGGVFCCGDPSECRIAIGSTRSTVFIDDVVMTNNYGDDGAAIYTTECDIDVRNTVLRDNYVDDDGGAVDLRYSTATFDAVTIDNNEALDGGAMALFYSSLTMTGSTISNNTNHDKGAAIWASYDTVVTISDTVFENNTNLATRKTAYGGAIIAQHLVTLDNVSFVDNTAPTGGGGIFVWWDAVVEGTLCDFSGNSPDDLWAAAGKMSYTAGTDYSFSCTDEACTPK